MVVGERIRDSRHSQHLSLTDVATKAGISAATLSRIETSKQGIDLALFLNLAKILKAIPQELLGENGAVSEKASDPLVRKITQLASTDRTRLWKDLATARRARRRGGRSELNQQVEELLAQFEYIRGEIESVRTTLKRR
jgi:transcriptional regulator with XRE-family HTH domain